MQGCPLFTMSAASFALSPHHMVEGSCIVYYHGNDWDGVPARQRYLMEAMSQYLPVYYIDKGRDLPGRVTWHKASERVTVIRGLARLAIGLDARRLGWLMKFYAPWALRHIRRRYSKILLWSAENCLRVDRFVPHDYLVFDSIDPAFDESPADLSATQRTRNRYSSCSGLGLCLCGTARGALSGGESKRDAD